jgi:hypothetical protein
MKTFKMKTFNEAKETGIIRMSEIKQIIGEWNAQQPSKPFLGKINKSFVTDVTAGNDFGYDWEVRKCTNKNSIDYEKFESLPIDSIYFAEEKNRVGGMGCCVSCVDRKKLIEFLGV